MPSAIPQKPATRWLLHYLAAASALLPIVNAAACAYQPGIRAELIAASGCSDSELEVIDPDEASLGPGRWMGRCRDRFFTCGWRSGSVECGPAAAAPAGGGWAPTWGAATRVLLEGGEADKDKQRRCDQVLARRGWRKDAAAPVFATLLLTEKGNWLQVRPARGAPARRVSSAGVATLCQEALVAIRESLDGDWPASRPGATAPAAAAPQAPPPPPPQAPPPIFFPPPASPEGD